MEWSGGSLSWIHCRTRSVRTVLDGKGPRTPSVDPWILRSRDRRDGRETATRGRSVPPGGDWRTAWFSTCSVFWVYIPNTTCLGLVDLPKYLGGQCKDPLFTPLTATKCHAKPPGGLPRALASGAPEAPLEAPLAPESTWDGSKGGSRPMSSMARPWIEMD